MQFRLNEIPNWDVRRSWIPVLDLLSCSKILCVTTILFPVKSARLEKVLPQIVPQFDRVNLSLTLRSHHFLGLELPPVGTVARFQHAGSIWHLIGATFVLLPNSLSVILLPVAKRESNVGLTH